METFAMLASQAALERAPEAHDQPDVMFTVKEAAEFSRLSASYLNRRRSVGDGPPYILVPGSRRVIYPKSDLVTWLNTGRRRSTSDDGAGDGA
jgi:hypothetical protein